MENEKTWKSSTLSWNDRRDGSWNNAFRMWKRTNGKVKIEVVQYKPEAVDVFEELEKKFNETHDNIELVIDSPNDAMTILKTRFIREDYPDIIGIGSDVNYSNFLDSDMLMDISDFDGLDDIKEAYLKTDKEMEYVPMDGVYAMPYMANASGVLYNKEMFEEHGWTIQPHGMNLLLCVKESKLKGFSRCILDSKIPGPVWLRGMRSLQIWLRLMCVRR